MTNPAPHFDLGNLADAMDLLYAGRRDQAKILRTAIADRKVRRPQHDVDRIEAPLPAMFRIAQILHVMKQRRDELPRWLVALAEDGDK